MSAPELYLRIPKSNSTKSWAASQMRCQVIVLAVRTNWRRCPVSDLEVEAGAETVAVIFAVVSFLALVLAVPLAHCLAAVTLTAYFVRSLPGVCRRWGLVCGTIAGALSPSARHVAGFWLWLQCAQLAVGCEVFRILGEMCIFHSWSPSRRWRPR